MLRLGAAEGEETRVAVAADGVEQLGFLERCSLERLKKLQLKLRNVR